MLSLLCYEYVRCVVWKCYESVMKVLWMCYGCDMDVLWMCYGCVMDVLWMCEVCYGCVRYVMDVWGMLWMCEGCMRDGWMMDILYLLCKLYCKWYCNCDIVVVCDITVMLIFLLMTNKHITPTTWYVFLRTQRTRNTQFDAFCGNFQQKAILFVTGFITA